MSKLRQAAEQEPVECMCGICKLGKREWVGLTDEEILLINGNEHNLIIAAPKRGGIYYLQHGPPLYVE
jgi:hypothetical protein